MLLLHVSTISSNIFRDCNRYNLLFQFTSAVALIQVNTRLNEESRELQKQLEKDRNFFESRIHDAEATNDELQVEIEQLHDERRAVEEDFSRKIEALEKQLKSDKQFLEVKQTLNQ